LNPRILPMLTICLKFQLTTRSALATVAMAMCCESARNLLGMTFSLMYEADSAFDSSSRSTLSMCSEGMSSSSLQTSRGA
jgi:hypothetical protein